MGGTGLGHGRSGACGGQRRDWRVDLSKNGRSVVEVFGEYLDSEVGAVSNLVKRVHPLMRVARGGIITNMLSPIADNTFPTDGLHYVTTPSVLMGLSKAGADITLAAFARTEPKQSYPDRILKMEATRTPLSRLVDRADVAEPVSYLAEEGAGFVTGINRLLIGGQDMP